MSPNCGRFSNSKDTDGTLSGTLQLGNAAYGRVDPGQLTFRGGNSARFSERRRSDSLVLRDGLRACEGLFCAFLELTGAAALGFPQPSFQSVASRAQSARAPSIQAPKKLQISRYVQEAIQVRACCASGGQSQFTRGPPILLACDMARPSFSALCPARAPPTSPPSNGRGFLLGQGRGGTRQKDARKMIPFGSCGRQPEPARRVAVLRRSGSEVSERPNRGRSDQNTPEIPCSSGGGPAPGHRG